MQLLVIADLTKGIGRFNLAQRAIATAVGIGASFSHSLARMVAKAGYNAGFLTMAAIAAPALALFWYCLPEAKSVAQPIGTGNKIASAGARS